MGVKHLVSSVEHPQTNGQAEAANKVICGNWKVCGPRRSRAYCEGTIACPKLRQGKLLSDSYGSDAMILVELGKASWKRTNFDEQSNDYNLRAELDLVQEVHVEARIWEEVAKLRAAQWYNTQVRERAFQRGDLVCRKVGKACKNKQEGKLVPNWDGHFRIVYAFHNIAYKLEELGGKLIPKT